MRINFARHSYQARSLPLSSQRLVNWFVEPAPQDAKSQSYLINTPGLKNFSNAGSGPIRGMITMGGVMYVVSADEVYSINSSGTATKVGDVGFQTGRVRMSQNGTQILIVEVNGDGYIATSSAVNKITDADFPTVDDVTYQDGYFIVTERDSGNIYISGLLDGTTWNAADFANVEENPDDNVGLVSAGGHLWIMGDSTTQIYYNSGNAAFPFEPIIGAFHETGCVAKETITQLDGTVLWFSDDRFVYASNGNNITRISTFALEREWATYSTVSDAFSFTYSQDGHKFYVVTFPTEKATFVYDFTSQLWHERSGDGVTDDRWRANAGVFAYGKTFVGDYRSGEVWELDLDTYTDDGETIIRQAILPPLFDEYKRLTLDMLQIDFEAGVGTTSGQGSDPEVMLSWSDDGGRTFGTEITRKLGKIGEYNNRAIFRRLGQARQRVFKVSVSDPVKCIVSGAFAEIRGGRK